MYHSRVILLLLVALSLGRLGQSAEQQFRATVKVSVDAEDGSTKSRIESYLNRGLRSLGDVTLTDGLQSYELGVTVLQSQQMKKYALSVLVVVHLRSDGILSMLSKQVDEDTLSMVKAVLSGKVTVMYQSVAMGGPADLQSVCENIVTRVDTAVFERDRKEWQRVFGGGDHRK